jgi:hypothetical protein
MIQTRLGLANSFTRLVWLQFKTFKFIPNWLGLGPIVLFTRKAGEAECGEPLGPRGWRLAWETYQDPNSET